MKGVRRNINLLTHWFSKVCFFFLNKKIGAESCCQKGQSSLPSMLLLKVCATFIWVDNELVNYNLVRLGYATVKYVASEKLRYLKKLRKAEELARNERLRVHSLEEENVSNS